MFKKVVMASLTMLLLPALALAATTFKVTPVASPLTGGKVTQVPNSGLGYAKIVSGGSANFKAGTNFGYAITGVSSPVGSATPVAADGTFTLSGVTGDGAVTVTYAKVPGAVSVSLTPSTQNVAGTGPTSIATFTALNTVTPAGTYPAATYAWAVTRADGITPAPEATLTSTTSSPIATLTTTTYGTYSVTVTVSVTVGSITVPSNTYRATATFLAAGVSASASCTGCHTGRDPSIVTAYAASVHAVNPVSSCNGCHVVDLSTGGMGALNGGTVSKSTFLVLSSSFSTSVNGVAKGAPYCTKCHTSIPHVVPVPKNNGVVGATYNCNECHTASGSADAHSISLLSTMSVGGCVDCHSVQQPNVDNPYGGPYVNDNSGVRLITAEFGKWSHHVTGVTLDNAHCAACHLEGTVRNGKIAVDATYHVADKFVHLRNADDDSDMQWDPAAPNHTTMDNFCMSCHDSNGAVSTVSVAIQGYINGTPGVVAPGKTASAKNPFGDTISNRYDKMQRPGVTNVSSQFDIGNNSHHAVKGPRYSGNSRFTGTDANGNARRQIASAATFAANSSQTLQGVRSTIYDAGNFNQLYTPLHNAVAEVAPRTGAANLGDDSTLHCGDCHTVGQWKVGSAETANGSPTPVAIGAHGSNNEYLLRNTIGTDARHTQNAFVQGNITGTVLWPAGVTSPTAASQSLSVGSPIPNGLVVSTNPGGAFLVCYNCHAFTKYGSVYLQTGVLGGHVGEYDAAGRCNGIGDTIPFNGYTTGTKTDGTQFASRFMGPVTKYSSAAPYVGEQDPQYSNIFGIQCINCHNSGPGNAYGGIHGSANNTDWAPSATATLNLVPRTVDPSVTGGAYIDGMGNTQKVERFLPGLNNTMHVPGTLGGVTDGVVATVNTAFGPAWTYLTGGVSNDTNWEQKHWQQTAATVINNTTGVATGTASAGAGCYTLGTSTNSDLNYTAGQEGPSVTGQGGPATELIDTWGGCDDHTAKRGAGNHGFVKKIVRPVTY